MPTMPTSGRIAACAMASAQPWVTCVSLFKKTTRELLAAFAPWLQAWAKPRLLSFVRQRMRPAACSDFKNSDVPSVEALSTTMISRTPALFVRAIDSRQPRVNERLLKTGMTTETGSVPDVWAGGGSTAGTSPGPV